MAKHSFFHIFRVQRRPVPPVIKGDLTGKVIMVVGANGGIGFEASKHYARMNPAKLILACRSKERGAAALKAIQEETGYQGGELRLINLGSFASVSAFAEAFEKEGRQLDILVANAATIPLNGPPTRTEDGWETTLQINNLSTSLLSILLLPTLIRTAEANGSTSRLVIVGSGVHFWTKLEKKVIAEENPLRTFDSDAYWTPAINRVRYFDTKLINLLFVRALNDRLSKDAPLIVNAVNPGYCYSNLRSTLKGFYAFIDGIMERLMAHTPEEGSRQLVWSAVGKPASGNIDELRGAYISESEVCEPSDWVISEEGQKAENKIWDNLIAELAGVNPQVKLIVDEFLTAKAN